MGKGDGASEEETQPLTKEELVPQQSDEDDFARDSLTSASTTSLVLEHLNKDGSSKYSRARGAPYTDGGNTLHVKHEPYEVDEAQYYPPKPADRKARRYLWILGTVCLAGWLLALVLFITRGTYKHASTRPHDPAATKTWSSGKKVTLDQVQGGQWRARKHDISWIADPNGADGLLLEQGGEGGKGYLVVEDVRHRNEHVASVNRRTLMVSSGFFVGSQWIVPSQVWPSPNLRKVLVMSDRQSNWRHSFTGLYWVFDVDTQSGEALDGASPSGRIQLASWSPDSKSIVFTRENNMFLRKLDTQQVEQITTDGGTELFNGVPDWVYEEEVFAGNSATWWSDNGNYIAFLRTNETAVPTYPVQYFVSRPSGQRPKAGEENYPEVRDIKYPKAGAPNPTVNIQFYDVVQKQIFSVPIADDFPDLDRLITEVVWAGNSGKVIVRETNRESDVLKVVLMDVERRSGKTIRTTDVSALDGGWFEVSEDTRFVQSDPKSNRPHDGYIDTIIHQGNDHLAYFTPLDNPNPILLTSGDWEVVKAPSAIDLQNNYVYFVATKESSIQRHVYRVKLDGTGLEPVTDTGKEGYYDVSFSKKAGYALLSYNGPSIPWQRVISTPSNLEKYESVIEENKDLADFASQYELPLLNYQTVNIDGFELNLVERRPPHFTEKKKYPVLFYMYQGPGSQTVDKRFNVDFQSFVASSLGYIVVTLDGRGTGFRGRKTRCIVRGNIGHYEAHDQIEAAKIWAAKKYVDAERLAIWGWSYGGFTTLKTIEKDAGRTFKYGMAVAPVTDWRFYDSVYTERYMHTPQHNQGGYDNASITDTQAMAKNVRFLIMHGVADDNVHMQSTLTLLDKLDLAGVENYDVHVFPDSDHSIYFHNANRIVYDKLATWLINAFNGEWLKTDHPVPIGQMDGKVRKR